MKGEQHMAGKYDVLSRIILQNVGGKSNIAAITHCVTRLRFRLRDESKANTDMLKSADGIVTVIQSGGQYQVVIGNHVPDVFASLVSVGRLEGLVTRTEGDDAPREKAKPFDALISIITGVFSPFLGVFCACGILKGVLALLSAVGALDAAGGTYHILYALGDAAFYFLPPILGFTAAKRFRLPEMEGLLIGLALLHPNLLAGAGVDVSGLFRIPVILPPAGDYSGSVIPVICAVAFAAWFEEKFRNRVPDTVKLFAVPLITLLVTFSLTVLVIGPVASAVSGALSFAFNRLYDLSPVVMGAAVGALWQVLVIFGLHWSLIPIALINMAAGGDVILAGMFGATFAQTGAVLGIWLKTGDNKLRSLAPAAFISAVAGVTEPAIYGITLPKKGPFIRTCAIAGVAGGFLGLSGVKAYQLAGMGVFGYTAYIDAANNSARGMVIAVIVSLLCVAAGFASELVFYRDGESAAAKAAKGAPGASGGGETIDAPLSGRVIPLDKLSDPVFAEGTLGPGVGILPSEGRLYAPADGVVAGLFHTHHAYSILTDSGTELLIHIGMNTVALNGRGFRPIRREGDRVKRGELLMEFDLDVITQAGCSVETPVLITNPDGTGGVEPLVSEGEVRHGDPLIRIPRAEAFRGAHHP